MRRILDKHTTPEKVVLSPERPDPFSRDKSYSTGMPMPKR